MLVGVGVGGYVYYINTAAAAAQANAEPGLQTAVALPDADNFDVDKRLTIGWEYELHQPVV